jgi:STE24 endopeptidase
MISYLPIILTFIIARCLINAGVGLLNAQHVSTTLPAEFSDSYDAQSYRQSQEYLRDNTRFDVLADCFLTAVTVIFIVAGGFNLIDKAARSLSMGGIVSGLAFAGIITLASQLLHIPFSIYETFVIEEKYGFNKTTPKTFTLDIMKSWLLILIIGAPVFAGALWFFGKTGDMAWLYCWIAMTIVQVSLIFISPVVIMPLFNKFVPLEEGELRTAIEAYATAQRFRMKGVFTMDGSKRSTKSNAFFTGFGKFRRIVLYDTLISKHSVGELVSVLAHEIGHYRKKHITKSVLASIATTGFMLFLLSLFINNQDLFNAFRMTAPPSIYASLFFFGFLFTPISMLFSLVGNAVSRRREYEADSFALATTGDPESMISALKKLAVDNLSNLTPHPAKVILDYSHPPMLERIARLKESSG